MTHRWIGRRAAVLSAIALSLLGVSAGAQLPVVGATLRHVGPLLSATPTPCQDIHCIQHVVIIMQENRSFDNYFGTYPNADGIPMASGTPTVCVPDPATQQCVRPYHDPSAIGYGGPHGTAPSVNDIDGGKMDGFIAQAEQYCNTLPHWPNPACAGNGPFDVMGYHDGRDIPNYWSYARNFVLQDHMFEPAGSMSLPAHLYLVSAWSAQCSRTGDPSSCVSSLSPDSLLDFNPTPVPQPRPNYAWTDITYLLNHHTDASGNPSPVSWGYYVGNGTVPDCPDGAPVCQPVQPVSGTGTVEYWNPLPFFTTVQQDGEQNNVQPVKNFYSAASNGTLPAVAWIVPDQRHSEHPISFGGAAYNATIVDGQAYVTSLINSIMHGPEWNSTAIFLAWDDWGGFYDHVPPPTIDGNGYGIRVPGLVISPYAKHGFIDHQTLSFDAYLKFIEDVFLNGQRLDPATDGRPDPRPDVRENAPQLGNLANDFDFTQAPRPPIYLPLYPNGTPTPTATSTPTQAATSTPTQTATSTATPVPATSTPTPAKGRLAVNPSTGGYPQSVSITGTGFAAGEQVNVYWDSRAGAPAATTTTDPTGSFVTRVVVPPTPFGLHTLVAVGQSSATTATAQFQVTAKTFLQASSGHAGTANVLTGTGFAANELVTAWWKNRGVYLGSATTNASGTFTRANAITFTVPMSTTGTYPVIAVGQTSNASNYSPFTITGP